MAEINTNLDTTPLPPNNLVAKDPQSAELAGYVRTKTFGRDVRESIARSIELNSTRSKSAEILASETVNVANDLTDRFNQQIGALTEDSEVIDARGGKATLGQRLDETDVKMTQEKFISKMDNKHYQQNIRFDHTAKLSRVDFPTAFTWQNAPIQVFSDGKVYSTFFDVAQFKNVGGKTYYIDAVNGLNTNDGLTEGTAFQFMNKALSVALDGDTIIILDKLLSRTSMDISNLSLTKNINIIAKTKTVINGGDTHTFTQTGGYTKVWETTRTNTLRVVDYPKKYEFKKVNSVAECNALPGSWYTDGTKVYIHTLESTKPQDDVHFVLIDMGNFFTIDGSNRDVKVYFENIEIVGGVPSISTKNSATTKPSIYMKDCGVFFNSSTTQGAIYAAGCNEAFFQNVEASYSWEDGFDYHLLNGRATHFIERDCIGHSNGRFNQIADNFNGSTAHNDCKGIRVGGHYYNNIGPNIADVQGVVQTVNYRVSSFDSSSTQGVNFGFQISDKEMWLFGCISFGNVADLYHPTGGTMYVDENTVYFTHGGLGSFNEI